MKKIVSMLSRLFFAQGLLALTAILRNKVLAVKLHRSGLGEFGQISNVATMFFVIGAVGLMSGIARNVARAETKEERQEFLSVANGVVLLTCFVAFLFCVAVILLGKADAMFGIGTSADYSWMLLFAVGFTLADALRQNYFAMLQAEADSKGLGPERAYGILFASVVTLPLVFIMGLWGAVIQFAAIVLLQTIVHGLRVRQLGFNPLKAAWSIPVVRQLLALGMTTVAFFIVDKITDVWVRTALEKSVGKSQMGLLFSSISITGQLRTIFVFVIGSMAVASVSKEKTHEGQTKVVSDLMTVLVPALTYGSMLLIAGAPFLVRALFAADFQPADKMMGWIVCGDYASNVAYILITPLLAQQKLVQWLAIDMVLLANRTWISLLLIGSLGVQAFGVGALIAYIVHLVISLASLFYLAKLSVAPKLVVRTVMGLGFLLVATWLMVSYGWLGFGLTVVITGVLFWIDEHQFNLISRLKKLVGERFTSGSPPPESV